MARDVLLREGEWTDEYVGDDESEEDLVAQEVQLRDGAVQLLRALVEHSHVPADEVLAILIQVGSGKLARSPSTSSAFYELLEDAIERGSQLALDEALQLFLDPGSNPGSWGGSEST